MFNQVQFKQMEIVEMKSLMAAFGTKLWIAMALLMGGIAVVRADDTGGCADSPENPTVVLVLLGVAAASLPTLLAQFRKMRGQSDAN
jgi:hypothetical protein